MPEAAEIYELVIETPSGEVEASRTFSSEEEAKAYLKSKSDEGMTILSHKIVKKTSGH